MRERPTTRRRLLKSGAFVGATGLLGSVSAHDGEHPTDAVPEVVEGFQIELFAPFKLPTALTFGPGGDGGPDLYATTISRTGYEPPEADQVDVASGGEVRRAHVEHTAAGPVVTNVTTAAEGFNVPLGVAFDGPDLLVSDSYYDEQAGRSLGVVYLVGDDGSKNPVVDGLPQGLHNTNHLEIGPDGRLYVTNGNATDDGRDQGPPDVFPYSGSILAVDVAAVRDDPAVLYWVDGDGNTIPPDEIADHPRNDDFESKVEVVAHGFRNVFGIAFGPDGVPYTGMNGSQDPKSQDVFYRLDDPSGTDYGYPWCFNEGDPGATGDDVTLVSNPMWTDDSRSDPSQYPAADALLGWHVCAVGLDFPSDGSFAFPSDWSGDPFIGECGAFSVQSTIEETLEAASTRNTGHKVTHVHTDDDGIPVALRDFVTGLSLPTDVEFGPHGAMFIADMDVGAYVVRPAPARDQFPQP